MKTDMDLRIERAKELGIYYSQRDCKSELSCGCGYTGCAKVIAYSEYDPKIMDLVICPACDSA